MRPRFEDGGFGKVGHGELYYMYASQLLVCRRKRSQWVNLPVMSELISLRFAIINQGSHASQPPAITQRQLINF